MKKSPNKPKRPPVARKQALRPADPQRHEQRKAERTQAAGLQAQIDALGKRQRTRGPLDKAQAAKLADLRAQLDALNLAIYERRKR